MALQAVLGGFEDLLAKDGRHRHGHPGLCGGRLLTLARADRLQGRCAPASRDRAAPSTLGDARIGGRPQDAAHRGAIPALPALGRGNLDRAEALGDCVEADGRLRVGLPGTHVLHAGGLDGGNLEPARLPGPLGIEQRAIGRTRPRPQLPATPLGLATPSHPLGNQCARILRHGSTHLQEQLLVGGLTHGALDTCDPTATLSECIHEEHLMHRVARSTIWGRAQDPCQGGHGGPVPAALETGAIELGPALALIALDVLVGARPSGVRRHVVVEAAQWVCNRLRLVLPRCRDTGVQSDCHGMPPDDARAQGCCLLRVP